MFHSSFIIIKIAQWAAFSKGIKCFMSVKIFIHTHGCNSGSLKNFSLLFLPPCRMVLRYPFFKGHLFYVYLVPLHSNFSYWCFQDGLVFFQGGTSMLPTKALLTFCWNVLNNHWWRYLWYLSFGPYGSKNDWKVLCKCTIILFWATFQMKDLWPKLSYKLWSYFLNFSISLNYSVRWCIN